MLSILLFRLRRKTMMLIFLSFFCLFQLLFVTVLSPSSNWWSSKRIVHLKSTPSVEEHHHTSPSAKNTESYKRQKDAERQIRKLLSPYVCQSLGRVLSVEFTQNPQATKSSNIESADVLDIVYQKPYFRKKVDGSMSNNIQSTTPTTNRYVYVYRRYWEQLTMNTRNLIALAAQAKLGGRRVVQPMVNNTLFGNEGRPFGTYFDVAHMNYLLETSGYASLAEKKEYDKECSLNTASHATLHFLYNQDKAARFTKDTFQLSDEQYSKISAMTKQKGWTRCTFISKFINLSPSSEQFCVDPTMITDWKVLERDVLKGTKCLGIVLWRGIGGGFRTFFSEKHLKISSQVVQFSLKPSLAITSKVDRFKKTHLSSHYVAIHVRGEKVVTLHNLKRLKKCLRILTNVVQVLKESFGIRKVLLASDMSSYGSGVWEEVLKGERYTNNTLKSLHDMIISRTGAIVYNPTDRLEIQDRGIVSLTEISLISSAQHLITIGRGSFQEWIIVKFLELHRDDSPKLWSLTRMCSMDK